jgi:hypothetical protein
MIFNPRNISAVFGISVIAFLSSAQTNAPSAPAAQDSGKIIQFLSHTIPWSRELAAEQKNATEPSDLTFIQENRRVADQIVQLAFDFARNQAQVQARGPNQQQSQADSGSQSQRRTGITES